MRHLGFSIRGNSFKPPAIPFDRLARVSQSFRRRLDDDIESVFDKACAGNNLEVATDLLVLLEKMDAPRPTSQGMERRITGAVVERTRQKLKLVRG